MLADPFRLRLGESGWTIVQVEGASIGWRIHGGCFWIGAFEGSDLGATRAVLKVRSIARERGFTRLFWQAFPETGTRILDVLKHDRVKVDYVQMYCDVY